MLQNTKELYGYQLIATDGAIGQVKDFYFDEITWVIRYLVVDTGSWLHDRQVLLSPHAIGPVDQTQKTFAVNLTRQQIERSPTIEQHKPVSWQYEVDHYQHYGFPTYWNGGARWGVSSHPQVTSPPKDEDAAQPQYHHRQDKHLRRAKAVVGYALHTGEGEIGAVSGFMVDEKNWAICQLVVDTGPWYPGKTVLIPSHTVERISHEDAEIFVNLTKAVIHQTAKHGVTPAGA